MVLLWLAAWWRRTAPREVPPAEHVAVWSVLLVTGAVVGSLAIGVQGASLRGASYVGATWGGATVLLLGLLGAVLWHARLVRRA